MDIIKCNICDCLSFAFNGLKKCKLNLEKISEDSRVAINRIAVFYRISEIEAVLLVLAIETHYSTNNTNNIVGIKEIRETIDCDVMKVLPFKNQILSLIEKFKHACFFFFRHVIPYCFRDKILFKCNVICVF